MGVTVAFTAAIDFGQRVVGLNGQTLFYVVWLGGVGIAILSMWTLFVIVYRYLPRRRTPWKTTLVAATFAALAHELLKVAFSWYATEMANYASPLGNLATIAVLLLWIYYGSLVFILGGEVAYVYALMASRRSEAE
jgi:membrane protein